MKVFLARLKGPDYRINDEIHQPYYGRELYMPWLARKLKSTPLKRESLVVMPASVPGIIDDEEMLSLEPLRKVARMKQLNLMLGVYHKTKIPGRMYNTSALINHRGDVSFYHKRVVLEEEGLRRNVIRGTHSNLFAIRQNEQEFRILPFIDHDLLHAESRNGMLLLPREVDDAHAIVVQSAFDGPWERALAVTSRVSGKPVIFSAMSGIAPSGYVCPDGKCMNFEKDGVHYFDLPLDHELERMHLLQDR
jgi:hypothetical protein